MSKNRSYIDPNTLYVKRPHPASLEPVELLKVCEFRHGSVSGPGGQHRNRNATGQWIIHLPTELSSKACERRERKVNQAVAIGRLRLRLALKCRTRVNRDSYKPSALWNQRREGTRMSVNPKHRDYPALLAEALDLLSARRWDVAGSAKILSITMSQLSRLVNHHPPAFAMMNEGRASVGLPPLRK
jgi:hypothetical protein